MAKELTAAVPAQRPHHDGAEEARRGAEVARRGEAAQTTDARGLARSAATAFLLAIVVLELAWFACLTYAAGMLVAWLV